MFESLQPTIIFALAYSLAGRTEVTLGVRRYLGWVLFTVFSSIYISLSLWQYLCYLPLLLALHLPYGGGLDLNDKILKRLLPGFVAGLTGLGLGFWLGVPYLGVIQFCLAILGSVYLGAFNPVPAWVEEALIAVCYTCIISYM